MFRLMSGAVSGHQSEVSQARKLAARPVTTKTAGGSGVGAGGGGAVKGVR